MSATNHTTNYNLPQFIGTDKPTWLNDVNGAFSTIDTQMKSNADSATSASSSATTANNAIGTLGNLNTEEKTNLVGAINEVNTNLGTVSGVASGASSSASQANTAITALQAYLTLNRFKSLTATSNCTIIQQNLNSATNSAGSVGKIYGAITINVTNASGLSLTIPTDMRPTEALTVNGVALVHKDNCSTGEVCTVVSINIATNGNVTLSLGAGWYNQQVTISFMACLLFLQNFGDTPIPQ